MAKMKAINPRVMEMRERLKDKPQQMQQEMMRIYREERSIRLGGCLPILVQMPFFIALYCAAVDGRDEGTRRGSAGSPTSRRRTRTSSCRCS
jgi:YidC/Oxa1 family membrane protein insertase